MRAVWAPPVIYFLSITSFPQNLFLSYLDKVITFNAPFSQPNHESRLFSNIWLPLLKLNET